MDEMFLLDCKAKKRNLQGFELIFQNATISFRCG